MHRNIHGHKGDHALLDCTWNWRIRRARPRPAKDFSTLANTSVLSDFEEAVEQKLSQLAYNPDLDDVTEMYDKICAAIQR